MEKFKRIGIDLAKNDFQVCPVDHAEKRVINKKLRRAEVLKFFSDSEPCLIGLEACGTAHYWARELIKLGHKVKLIASQKVKVYVVGNKNDMRDAEAILLFIR
ncbi:Transposase [Thorsellia anophelis DSM 18579]|uniref:Transposase n=1 Tax=Thorsellia anophelis DSM 18579 TaxID=1123402 RepID=A0A1I0FE49_9GAMM|nr:Transposase [Thorsellia anophelis DSM 18579]